MTYRFVAHAASAEIDADFIEAGIAEGPDGNGFVMQFMCDAGEPDDQEVSLGLDTHCLVTAGQGTAYGCVQEAVLVGNVLHISLDPSALEALGLDHAEIEATLEAPAEDITRFREVLAQVLAYGREDALPIQVAV